MPILRLFLFISLLVHGVILYASTSDSLLVTDIQIKGNKVTHSLIILRELDLKKGDWIRTDTLPKRLQQNTNQVFNTRLFNHVNITSIPSEGGISILIELTEKWYIWPFPVLKFADRNFNIWWETKDPERLNIGLNVYDFNFRGRAEKLKLRTLWGYTRMISLDYEIPYMDMQKKKGLHVELNYFSNKEVWHKAEENRLQFLFDPQNRAIRYFQARVSFLYRPKLFIRHQFSVGWEDILVSDTILQQEQNPEFLAGQGNQQMSLEVFYTFKWDRRDISYNPLKGHYIEVNVEPRFLFENKSLYVALRLNAEKFYSLGNNFFAGMAFRGKLSFPNKQPYNLYQSLGYKFFVRGFEPYVIDGQHFGMINGNLRYCLVNKVINLPLIKMKQFKKAPVSLYVSIFSDGAYVSSTLFREPGNTYQNRWLQGYGVGLDFVTYYDRVLRLEYSINNFGRKGLYLHFTAPI